MIQGLVKSIEEGMRASVKTKGKDGIFILGNTGSGKSTMIHYLDGVQIQVIHPNHTERGQIHTPKIYFNRSIEGSKVGDDGNSLTKLINII